MKLPLSRLHVVALASAALTACVHTPPGTSVEIALAKKPELVRLPPSELARAAGPASNVAVEPELPTNDKVDQVAEAFTRGQFCMQTGKDEEAIAAFEQAVQLDPSFAEAWSNLAMLYEKNGQEKKALNAFRASKKIARK